MIPTTENHPILLVEDDANDVFLTVRALEKSRLRNPIIVCHDGEEALDYLFEAGRYAGQSTILPEVVLLDLNLPKVGGMEVLGQIRAAERTRSLPVIVMTSSNDEEDRINSYDLGAVSYVRKPIDFRNFLDAVSECGLHWLVVNKLPRANRAAYP